jgi:ABC-2 type transport system permease protein
MQFILFGMVVSTLYQTTITAVASLIEDRENNFTQELFVAPISRYALILGKIVGGTVTSLFSLFGLIVVALLMQIELTPVDIGRMLLMWPVICIAGGALGILFISIVRDPRAAEAGILLLVFPQMFLAGILIPISESGGLLGILSHLMPLTYVADLMRNVIYMGRPELSEIVLYSSTVDLAITVVVSVFFIVVGTWVFNRSERAR